MFNRIYVSNYTVQHSTAQTIQTDSSMEFASSHTAYHKPQKVSNFRVLMTRDHVWCPSRIPA